MQIKLKHVKKVVNRHGKTYYYHRPTWTRLPDDPRSPEFQIALGELNKKLQDTSIRLNTQPGTLRDIIGRYKATPEFTQLGLDTRKGYIQHLDWLSENLGTERAADFTNGVILAVRDHFSATPRKANYVITILRRVLRIALNREWISDCPALRQQQEKLKTGPGHRAWPDRATERFRQHAPPELIYAMELALWTGQRQSDLLALQWVQIDDGLIRLTQRKTGKPLIIPIHKHLQNVLEAIPKRSMIVLTMRDGRPWQRYTFRHYFHKAVLDCDLKGLTFHGLRHTAARRLAEEAGGSTHEIAAITGHESLSMVQRYTRDANQERLAKRVIERLK